MSRDERPRAEGLAVGAVQRVPDVEAMGAFAGLGQCERAASVAGHVIQPERRVSAAPVAAARTASRSNSRRTNGGSPGRAEVDGALGDGGAAAACARRPGRVPLDVVLSALADRSSTAAQPSGAGIGDVGTRRSADGRRGGRRSRSSAGGIARRRRHRAGATGDERLRGAGAGVAGGAEQDDAGGHPADA